jgi:hypothetical protein
VNVEHIPQYKPFHVHLEYQEGNGRTTLSSNLKERGREWEVNGTGSCTKQGFDISGVETSGFSTSESVSSQSNKLPLYLPQ